MSRQLPVFGLVVTFLLLSGFTLNAATRSVPQQYQTIQSAIDAAQPGDIVLVSPGRYQERLQLTPQVTVKSVGDNTPGKLGLQRAEVTILDGKFPAAQGPGVEMAEGAIIDGFTVTGIGKYDEEAWQQHWETFGEEQTHQNIGVPGTAGISVIGVEQCTIRNNIVHHIGYTGIAIQGAEGKRVSPHVIGNITYRNMGGGIGSMKQSTATIEKNICFENYYAGIGHNHASPLVLNNTCYANIRAGIGISEYACPIVRGNRCYQNRRAGIGIRDGEATQPIIEHNTCYENEMAGIGNREHARPIIRHNTCYKNKMAGIGSRDGGRALIEHNQCYENGMAGIGSRLGASPVIRNNRCYRNTMAGIGVREGARPVVEDNECFENKMAGIGSRRDAAPVIRNNRCYRNMMAGIGAELGARPVILDNECHENQMAGIGSRQGAVSIIQGNHSHHNQMAGIGVRDRETFAVIIGNRCLENRLVAIGVPDGGNAYIHGNQLQRTGGGAPPIIALRGGASAVVTHNSIHQGGVAGILLSGQAIIAGNQFHGRGPKQQGSAIWAPFGGSFDVPSTLLASHNRSSGYRNLLNANKSHVTATANVTHNFSGPSLIVKQAPDSARVYDNTAYSDNPQDTVVDIGQADDVTHGNVLKKTNEFNAEDAPGSPHPKLWDRPTDGNAFHSLINSGQQRSIQDGPWKLVVTYGKSISYALFHLEQDPQEENDRSVELEQITFRLRGRLEQQEGIKPSGAPGK